MNSRLRLCFRPFPPLDPPPNLFPPVEPPSALPVDFAAAELDADVAVAAPFPLPAAELDTDVAPFSPLPAAAEVAVLLAAEAVLLSATRRYDR